MTFRICDRWNGKVDGIRSDHGVFKIISGTAQRITNTDFITTRFDTIDEIVFGPARPSGETISYLIRSFIATGDIQMNYTIFLSRATGRDYRGFRSEEHTSELQSRGHL